MYQDVSILYMYHKFLKIGPIPYSIHSGLQGAGAPLPTRRRRHPHVLLPGLLRGEGGLWPGQSPLLKMSFSMDDFRLQVDLPQRGFGNKYSQLSKLFTLYMWAALWSVIYVTYINQDWKGKLWPNNTNIMGDLLSDIHCLHISGQGGRSEPRLHVDLRGVILVGPDDHHHRRLRPQPQVGS